MLTNATLLRISDPPPASPGPDVSIRCAMTVPSSTESAALGAMAMHGSAVLYVRLADLPGSGAPAMGQHLEVQCDGCPAATWKVVHAAERVGGRLSHVQLFLEGV